MALSFPSVECMDGHIPHNLLLLTIEHIVMFVVKSTHIQINDKWPMRTANVQWMCTENGVITTKHKTYLKGTVHDLFIIIIL